MCHYFCRYFQNLAVSVHMPRCHDFPFDALVLKGKSCKYNPHNNFLLKISGELRQKEGLSYCPFCICELAPKAGTR